MTGKVNTATMDGSSANVKEFFQMNNADDIDSLVSQLSAKEKADRSAEVVRTIRSNGSNGRV